jgi:hypothetical protein
LIHKRELKADGTGFFSSIIRHADIRACLSGKSLAASDAQADNRDWLSADRCHV